MMCIYLCTYMPFSSWDSTEHQSQLQGWNAGSKLPEEKLHWEVSNNTPCTISLEGGEH